MGSFSVGRSDTGEPWKKKRRIVVISDSVLFSLNCLGG